MAEVCQALKVPRFSKKSIQPKLLDAWLPVLKASYHMVQWCHSGLGCGERAARPLGRPPLLALRSIQSLALVLDCCPRGVCVLCTFVPNSASHWS